MSWVALVPMPVVGRIIRAAVALSVSKAGRFVQRAYVTVQPDLLPGLEWWQNNAAVSVELGLEEHTGRLRIQAGGPFTIMGPTGKKLAAGKPNAPTLQIALSGLPAEGLKRQPVPWEVLGEALVVTLPWSGVTGCVKAEVRHTPKATPVEPTAEPGTRWTDDRKAVVARDYPAGVDVQSIVVTLNALPGAAVTAMHVNAMAGQLKLRRPPSVRPAPSITQSAKPAVSATPEMQRVLRVLRDAGGRVAGFKGLTHADVRLLRSCEEADLAEWRNSGEVWLLTPTGAATLAEVSA